jgi:hypothetical protein
MRPEIIRASYAVLFDALLEALHSELLPAIRVLRAEHLPEWDVADAEIRPGPDSTIMFESDPTSRRPLVSGGNVFYAEELALLQTEHLVPAAPVLIPARRDWLIPVLAMLPVRNWDYVSRHPRLLEAYQPLLILEELI